MGFQPLSDFSGNVYSQFGEDGIISEILDRIEAIQPLTKWCVEFGAHDGVSYSNTCNLIRSRGFHAVMIEPSPERACSLAENHPQPEVIKIASMVGLEGDTRLDRILATTPVPVEFDILSIDIDGCDYWILESIESYRPSVIVIEFNFTIPNAVEFVQPRDFSVTHGSSPRSLQRLAESMGYKLVATTFPSLIFVRRDLRTAVLGSSAPVATLEELRDDTDRVVYAFSGYDGTLLFSTPSLKFSWHRTTLDPARFQPIPKYWRSFMDGWAPRGIRMQSWRVYRRFSRRISWMHWKDY